MYSEDELDGFRARFYNEEPTQDFLADALVNGVADGTLALDDSEYAESFGDGSDDDGK